MALNLLILGERVMSTAHIAANKGDIAETILLPGDTLSAKFIAENFLENVVQYNSVINMFGYTGNYKGKKFRFKSCEWECLLAVYILTNLYIFSDAKIL